MDPFSVKNKHYYLHYYDFSVSNYKSAKVYTSFVSIATCNSASFAQAVNTTFLINSGILTFAR